MMKLYIAGNSNIYETAPYRNVQDKTIKINISGGSVSQTHHLLALDTSISPLQSSRWTP